MNDNTPILVGSGQYVDREPPSLETSLSPIDMAAEVARRAIDHAGARGDLAAHIDVLAVARLAGIMGAKRTFDLVPLCHPLSLDAVEVAFEIDDEQSAVHITATCKIEARTGVEMEALTAVSVAALTIYDMCKAVDRGMCISEMRLTYKSGGKSGLYEAK